MLKKLEDLKTTLAARLTKHREMANTAAAPDLRKDSLEIEAMQKALSGLIAEGAMKCPICGQQPVGMEQPNTSGGTEYEIGCRSASCHPPIRHSDGSIREICVRGGMIPKHAVEGWNAGPAHWMKAKNQTQACDTLAERAARLNRKPGAAEPDAADVLTEADVDAAMRQP